MVWHQYSASFASSCLKPARLYLVGPHPITYPSDMVVWCGVTVGVPAPPTLIQPVQASDARMIVTFDPPRDNGGLAITGYVLRIQPGNWQVECHASPYEITGLTNGQAYRVAVAAVNAKGRSVWSQESEDVTPGKRAPWRVSHPVPFLLFDWPVSFHLACWRWFL